MLIAFNGCTPDIAPDAFVAPTAALIGTVIVREGASVWYGTVLRGDRSPDQPIVIGARSNVQDNAVIHVTNQRGTFIGESVTIGHGAILEGCNVEDGAVICMNAVILVDARICAGAMVAAGSTVRAGDIIPAGHLAAGSPAVVKKQISGSAAWWIDHAAKHYVELSREYLKQGIGVSGDAPLTR